MKELENKIALVTGGNSGIGLATASKFIEHGATVIITGRRQEALDQAVQQLGPQAIGVLAEASDLNHIDRLKTQIQDRFGHLDIVFLNAGIAPMGPHSEVDEQVYDQIFNINVKGLFFAVQKLRPILSNEASIILNSSVVAHTGMVGGAVYAASKAAVRSFGRSLAGELSPQGIRVNTISPGPVETPIFGKAGLSEESLNQLGQTFATRSPLGRFGRPEEIAETVLFLASNRSSYLTGAEIQADGGLTQVMA